MSTLVSLTYLLCLSVSLLGMGVLDLRYRLFWFSAWRRAACVHAGGVAMFLLWDVLGIHFGVFFRGETNLMTGVLLAPELPLEELVFLIFLCWITMITFTLALRFASPSIGARERHPEDASA